MEELIMGYGKVDAISGKSKSNSVANFRNYFAEAARALKSTKKTLFDFNNPLMQASAGTPNMGGAFGINVHQK